MKHIRYRRSKYFYYLGIKKSTLIVALILALTIGSLFIIRSFAGQQTILSPIGEGITPTPIPSKTPQRRFPYTSSASYYCRGFEGNHTASGSIYHCDGLTFAHKTLPFGTKVKFLRDSGDGSGPVVTATCTDRGPFIEGREFDFSPAVFERLGNLSEGVIQVRWEVVE